jgi:hypothetical protein
MSNQELIEHLVGLGHCVSTLRSSNNVDFIVVTGFTVPTGKHARRAVDVAVQFSTQIPYVAPSAIHVRPHLVAAGTQSSRDSELGSEWQYLSRQAGRVTSPQQMVAHIASVLGELQ